MEKPLEIDTPTQQRRILPDENGVDKKPDRDLTIPLITIRKPSTPGPGGKESYPKGGVGVWVYIYPLFNLFGFFNSVRFHIFKNDANCFQIVKTSELSGDFALAAPPPFLVWDRLEA